ncbi:MAG: aldo/keto reductase [Tissierellia bacterium]|nr:aldo/keto reductase [Tissierellia bacterium]
MLKLKLKSGEMIDAIGFGTYKIDNEKNAVESIINACDAGYRLFDTADMYKNHKYVAKALKESSLKRNEYKIATKIWPTDYKSDDTKRAIDKALKDLNTDYIDILYLHWRGVNQYEAWTVFEDYKNEGILKHLAVCNFNKEQMEEFYKNVDIKPEIDQLETHPYFQNNEMKEYLDNKGIILECWGPLAQAKSNLLEDDLLVELSNKYDKSPAQIALRWNIQRGAMIIPKSTHKSRIRENIEILNFKLDDEDMEKLKKLNKDQRFSHAPDDKEFLNQISKNK